jgi:polyisoprenoid-binding protein YceI
MTQLQTDHGIVRVPTGTWRRPRTRTYRVTGNLTIRDVTREIQVEANVEGAALDPWGNDRVGIAVRGSLDRTEFGLTWQQSLVGGGLLVGEQVAMRIDISAVRA